MPNKWNFSFYYRYYVYATPLIYLVGFTSNYVYMFGQRTKYY